MSRQSFIRNLEIAPSRFEDCLCGDRWLVLSLASAPGGEVSAEGSGRQQASEVPQTAVIECGARGDGCVPGMSALVQQVAKAARSSYEIVARHAALDAVTVVPGASVVGGLAPVARRIAHEAAAANQR